MLTIQGTRKRRFVANIYILVAIARARIVLFFYYLCDCRCSLIFVVVVVVVTSLASGGFRLSHARLFFSCSTLIKRLMGEYKDDFGFSTSHTTRAPRAGEVEGVDYHFTNNTEMEQAIKDGEFLEHARVHANMYGTSKKAVHDVTDSCRICILDIDVQGVKQLMRSADEDMAEIEYIWLTAPSVDTLEERLRMRGTETEEKIQLRLKNAVIETDMASALPFDYRVVNDDADVAYRTLKGILDQRRAECANHRDKMKAAFAQAGRA